MDPKDRKLRPFPNKLSDELREYFEGIAQQAVRKELAERILRDTIVDLSAEWLARAWDKREIEVTGKRRTGKAPRK
jgi:hypothetical protein